MTNPIPKPGLGDADLADKAVEAFARNDEDSWTKSCRDAGIGKAKCEAVENYLKYDTYHKSDNGEITHEERIQLLKAGFTRDFVYTLSGVNGKRPLQERVEWYSSHCVKPSAWKSFWWKSGPSEDERIRMIHWLEERGPEAKSAIPNIIKALENDDIRVRREAIHALGAFGADAKDATLPLVRALEDEDGEIRGEAQQTLPKLGISVIPALEKMIMDDGSAGHDNACGVFFVIAAVPMFSQYSPKIDQNTISALIRFLNSDNKEILRGAMRLLYEAGPDAKDASPRLVELLLGGNRSYELIETLKKIGLSRREDAASLISILKDPSSDISKGDIIKTLGNSGAIADDAVPILVEYAVSSNGWQSPYSFIAPPALSKMGQAAVIALILKLDDLNPAVRCTAASVFAQFDSSARRAIPYLERMRDLDPEQSCRDAAKSALKAIEKRIL